MRIDVITIFPDYLAPLRLSLLGRAQSEGRLAVHAHDLRDWTSDRRRTVDDTPYGGGPGMVMRPEPWGAAIDSVVGAGSSTGAEPTLIVPTPSGVRLDQSLAAELAQRPWLLIACGRYEGIDQRIVDHYATRMNVVELSIGDYVLGGGEVAALVLIEAVGRLLPGVVGNPESLHEESHTATLGPALLEYPVYTKPATWRGLDVPPILQSGHHDQIASWRRQESIRRTARRRPDLVHPSQQLTVADAEVRLAEPADVAELFVLQRCGGVTEALANDTLAIPALADSLEDLRTSLAEWTTLVVRSEHRLVACVRGRLQEGTVWEIGRLVVAPDLERRGLGRWLLARMEQQAPAEATSYRVVTGARSERNIAMYRRAGYRPRPATAAVPPGAVVLTRRIARTGDFG